MSYTVNVPRIDTLVATAQHDISPKGQMRRSQAELAHIIEGQTTNVVEP